MPARASISSEEGQGAQPTLFDTAVEVFRYLVVISPSAGMIAEVAELKARVAEHIGTYRGDKAIAHMTLMYAYLPLAYEQVLIEAIGRATIQRPAFTLHFSGVHRLPDNSTIYIDVLNKEPVIALRKAIRQSIHGNKSMKRLGIHPTSQPMITIARKLSPGDVEKAMHVLAPHVYARSEQVEDVVLLRGSQADNKYVVAARCPLGGA